MITFRTLFTLTLFAICGMAQAQYTPRGALPGVTYLPPNLVMPQTNIYINTKTIPKARRGYSDQRIMISCGPLTTAAPWNECNSAQYPEHDTNPLRAGGAFRISCLTSHWSFDDPIVKPRQSGMTHLHLFFGNTTTDAQRDPAKMDEYGRSTCSGGTINRTGYWVPIPIYHCPLGEVGCTRARDGEVQVTTVNNAYYKVEEQNNAAIKGVTWWPKGFQMIAGSSTNADPALVPGSFDCGGPNTTSTQTPLNSKMRWDRFPSTVESDGAKADPTGVPACTDINMLVGFPQCSIADESVLYLPQPTGGNMSGHVKPSDYYNGCTDAAFPHMHPSLNFNVHTPIAHADWDYIILSSDKATAKGVLRAGSTTTAIVLAASEMTHAYDYEGGYVSLNGERRQVIAYDGATKIATVGVPFSTAPAVGTAYMARAPGGRTMHADWANGWDRNPNFMGWGRSITDQIIRGCYFSTGRYGDPTNPSAPSNIPYTSGGSLAGYTDAQHFNLDCHDNLVGDPGDDSTAEPRVGGTYYILY